MQEKATINYRFALTSTFLLNIYFGDKPTLMASIKWAKLVQIDRRWIGKQFNSQFNAFSKKLKVHVYTVKASGTQILPDALVETLHDMLPDYVYSKNQIDKIGERKASRQANHFFGSKDPKAEGKYGELLLFALTEAALECKMIAHKIRTLTNYKDQVKGGDGIFLGTYIVEGGKKTPAYFIGESKVTKTFAKATSEALSSLNRFHDIIKSPEFRSTELIVAKENLTIDGSTNLDLLYDKLTPTTTRFKQQILVHPILLMYDEQMLKQCERKCNTNAELETTIKKQILAKREQIIASIRESINEYESLKEIHLEFFIIPHNSIDSFRNAMYYSIHSAPYPYK